MQTWHNRSYDGTTLPLAPGYRDAKDLERIAHALYTALKTAAPYANPESIRSYEEWKNASQPS